MTYPSLPVKQSRPRSRNRSVPPIAPRSLQTVRDAQVPLITQAVRLLLHLLEDVPYANLRFAERERLKRILARISGGVATAHAHLLNADRTAHTAKRH